MKDQKKSIVGNCCALVLAICLLGGMSSQVSAKFVWVKSEKRFYDIIDRKELAVVLFYREDKEVKRTPAVKMQVSTMKKMFESAAQLYDFKEAEVAFLAINVAKSKVSLLTDDYGVTQLPACILLKNGEPIKENGTIAQLIGFVSRDNLVDFIKKYCASRIDQIIEVKEKIRRQRAVETALYQPWGWGWGWGYSYPYYGGYGYGYPYYDGYYRPFAGRGYYGW